MVYCTVRLRWLASLYGKKSYSTPGAKVLARSMFVKLERAIEATNPAPALPPRLLTTRLLSVRESRLLSIVRSSPILNTLISALPLADRLIFQFCVVRLLEKETRYDRVVLDCSPARLPLALMRKVQKFQGSGSAVASADIGRLQATSSWGAIDELTA